MPSSGPSGVPFAIKLAYGLGTPIIGTVYART
jgi:hypothetical protein